MKTDQPKGKASRDKALSFQNLAAHQVLLKLKAPADNGSYDLRMYNASGEEMTSLNFKLTSQPLLQLRPR